MPGSPLDLTRAQILAFRRRVGALDERLPAGARSLRRAAWAGLQDSMPRAALLSIHARVEGAHPSSWEDPSLVQVWGPRFSVYVVPARDHAHFTLARLPNDDRGRLRAEEMAARIEGFLRGRRTNGNEIAAGLGVHNALRYAAATGTVLIRWEGARAPHVWTVPRPDIDPLEARRELARRYLHVYGPTTADAFATWAGIGSAEGREAFESLRGTLIAVRTPLGEARILARDESGFRDPPGQPSAARLLPSGDAYYLLHGADRELLIPDARRRGELWTSRVWPGALLVGGEIVGIWRRANEKLSIHSWRRLSRAAREAVEGEAQSLPLPGIEGRVAVRWND
jgi:DNA glycosylase AlkZ-like